MKKYFAKYLPVEGKIKEGEPYLNKGVLFFADPVFDEGNNPNNSNPRITNKKAVLFLCSREIQVGDEITWIGTGGSPQTPFGTKMKHDTPLTSGIMHENWIKVIGEISPEATWVKEGDEFDLKDFNPISAANIQHNKPITDSIRIKGPCGHFH